MTIEEKKAYLQRYPDLCLKVKQKTDELIQRESQARRVTPIWSNTPKGSPDGEGFAKLIEQNVELRQELNEKLKDMVVLRAETEAAISSVPDTTLQNLLRYRYLNGMKWEKIAEEMNYGKRWLTDLHKRALDKLLL